MCIRDSNNSVEWKVSLKKVYEESTAEYKGKLITPNEKTRSVFKGELAN